MRHNHHLPPMLKQESAALFCKFSREIFLSCYVLMPSLSCSSCFARAVFYLSGKKKDHGPARTDTGW